MTINHPIFGDVMSSELEKQQRARVRAAELKAMMEVQWQRGPVRNARRPTKWLPPIKHGLQQHGYFDGICGW